MTRVSFTMRLQNPSTPERSWNSRVSSSLEAIHLMTAPFLSRTGWHIVDTCTDALDADTFTLMIADPSKNTLTEPDIPRCEAKERTPE